MKGEHSTAPSASPNLLCEQGKPDLDKVWGEVHREASRISADEERLAPLMEDVFLSRDSFSCASAARLSRKLAREDMTREELFPLLVEILGDHPEIVESMAWDTIAINERDPACTSVIQPLLYYKGYMAIATYRISHQLWKNDRNDLALYFQSLASEVFSVDIHPAAQIGCGIFLDHATSLVIGETAIVEDDVSIMHEVTLGGTGKVSGNRHPVVRSGVLIGAGAKILGRVEIGQGAKVGAGSVVLSDVAPKKTVAGVPAVVVGDSSDENPAMAMDQSLHCSGL
ncbi:serine O-acetyltransferase [bacterium]|nr:serine O-acetyltransferase [Akkermansiaceae bacterium]MDB4406971.1 serine O-acetyltransferase [bacterium]MDA7649206.1 serine O-acetyltransferase [Akkermansiaceae bacterium]MDA7684220.1 serine O-acetyltransferase [Akkermansiaceae bacterium]MDB4142465.1 serine O-acetyltransferase [Akkermansiaceae bacterium]